MCLPNTLRRDRIGDPRNSVPTIPHRGSGRSSVSAPDPILWGRMLSRSAAEYVRTGPWLVIFPPASRSILCRVRNQSVGDALRDSSNPRQRG